MDVILSLFKVRHHTAIKNALKNETVLLPPDKVEKMEMMHSAVSLGNLFFGWVCRENRQPWGCDLMLKGSVFLLSYYFRCQQWTLFASRAVSCILCFAELGDEFNWNYSSRCNMWERCISGAGIYRHVVSLLVPDFALPWNRALREHWDVLKCYETSNTLWLWLIQ